MHGALVRKTTLRDGMGPRDCWSGEMVCARKVHSARPRSYRPNDDFLHRLSVQKIVLAYGWCREGIDCDWALDKTPMHCLHIRVDAANGRSHLKTACTGCTSHENRALLLLLERSGR